MLVAIVHMIIGLFEVIIESFLSATSLGLELNGIESLFCFGCVTSTVPSSFMDDCVRTSSPQFFCLFYLSILGNFSLWCLWTFCLKWSVEQ